jgi:phosphoglucosamine mutase
MSNLGMENSLSELGIPFLRTKVGDRYVIEALRDRGWQLGGESSGHIICSDLTTTGDAIVAALQVLYAMRDTSVPLNTLKKEMQKYPQAVLNVPIEDDFNITNHPLIIEAIDKAETDLQNTGRILIRPSGTEPLVRVMVEASDPEMVDKIVNRVAKVVAAEAGKTSK